VEKSPWEANSRAPTPANLCFQGTRNFITGVRKNRAERFIVKDVSCGCCTSVSLGRLFRVQW
jgi:sugar lactone lactonase YvrE